MSNLDIIENVGIKAKGRKELFKHLNHETNTMKQAIAGKCYDCMGYYADGTGDCQNKQCSLYPFMPYNPNRTKRVVNMTDERKKELSERLRKMRSEK